MLKVKPRGSTAADIWRSCQQPHNTATALAGSSSGLQAAAPRDGAGLTSGIKSVACHARRVSPLTSGCGSGVHAGRAEAAASEFRPLFRPPCPVAPSFQQALGRTRSGPRAPQGSKHLTQRKRPAKDRDALGVTGVPSQRGTLGGVREECQNALLDVIFSPAAPHPLFAPLSFLPAQRAT